MLEGMRFSLRRDTALPNVHEEPKEAEETEVADIVTRTKALLMQPAQEWPVIAAEPADTKGLILGYAAILSAIPPVFSFLGVLLLGGMLPGVGIGAMLGQGIVQYVLGLGSVWVIGKIIQTLAPMFGGLSDEVSAMKLSVYSPAASWVAGVFLLLPLVGIIVLLLGLAYGVYLFYVGAPVVAKVPADKAVPFTVAVTIGAIVLGLIVGLVTVRLFPAF